MDDNDLSSLENQVLQMIPEFHLARASQDVGHVCPIMLEALEPLLFPLDNYLPGTFQGTRDVRVIDWSNTLRVATWLHRIDLTMMYGEAFASSVDTGDHTMGPLLGYFLAPETTGLSLEEGAQSVLDENWHGAEGALASLQTYREELCQEVELLLQTHNR